MNPPLFNPMRRRLQTSYSSSIMEFRMHNIEGAMRNVSAQGACHTLADGRALATPIRAAQHARRRLGVFGAQFSHYHLQASPPNHPTLSAFERPCTFRTLRARQSSQSFTSTRRAAQHAGRRLGVFGAWFSHYHLQASSPNRPTHSAFVRPCTFRTLRDRRGTQTSSSDSYSSSSSLPGLASGRRSKSRMKRKIGEEES